MCGICGKLYFDREREVEHDLLGCMLAAIHHRGPDDGGFYLSGQIGLGHRRLAIIDLTSGQQPLSNEDNSIWITFNGEIYNFRELRTFLLAKGHRFRTNTDTEVIVHLYEEYGPECVQKLRGMFAFALWDDKAKTLMLARDRIGIKPLYYSITDSALVFASEIKAILQDGDVETTVSPQAIHRLLTFYYCPGEETLFRNVLKVAPGSYVLVCKGQISTFKYWDLNFDCREPAPDVERVKEQLRELLSEAVDLHMTADVPVGVLLSGGFDSTAMLALASQRGSRELRTFSIGFDDPTVPDERPYARLAAKQFHAAHVETTLSVEQFRDLLPEFVWHMEEPVAEPPAIALYSISKLAAEQVKVVISGEGGDEAFAGYSNYRNVLWVEQAKRNLGILANAVAPGLRRVASLLGSHRATRYAAMLERPFEQYYYSRTFDGTRRTPFSQEFAAIIDERRGFGEFGRHLAESKNWDVLSRMLYVDTKTWLVDDLLLKADKMTMANSLELRVPWLDHKLLEFAASLPSALKVRNGQLKYIAKKALQRIIPQHVVARPKAGFPVPYASWLCGKLSKWAADILLDRKTLSRAYFTRKGLEELLERNVTTGEFSKTIFCLIALELWHRTFIDNARLKRAQRCSSSTNRILKQQEFSVAVR